MCVCVCFFWQSLFLLCRFWKEWLSLAHPTGGKSCYVCMNVNESETCHESERDVLYNRASAEILRKACQCFSKNRAGASSACLIFCCLLAHEKLLGESGKNCLRILVPDVSCLISPSQNSNIYLRSGWFKSIILLLLCIS